MISVRESGVRASYIDGLGAPVNVTSRQTPFGGNGITPPLSDRTPQVHDAIVTEAGVYSVNDMTQTHLAAIPSINLSRKSITSLKSDDFAGLTGLTRINLSSNDLTILPDDIFDGLTGLTRINLSSNDLMILPDDIFDGLTALTEINLENNDLTTLPAGIFEGLTALTEINLENNDLTTLPAGIFEGLTALTEINLYNNDLSSLPADIFDGLTALERIRILLGGNDLTTLPDGIFEGLTGLTWLHLWGNAVDPISLTVSLEKVGNDQFKAVAPAGAPFNMMLPITVTSGSITGGIATLTIPAGAVESEVLTVTRAPDTTYAVSVNIGTLPRLPINHSGYSLVKSNDLPLVFAELGGSVLVPVSERTPQVRDAIVRAAGVNSAADVTEAHLAAITTLSLAYKKINALKAGDFDGLSALVDLRLDYNNFTTLPDGIFDGVPALKHLNLIGNKFTTLPDGIFDGLSSLKNLRLATNQLSSLPENIFDGLSALNILELNGNTLTTIPNSVSGLTTLTHLYFRRNRLTRLPDAIFEGLSSLTQLHLTGNAVDPMQLTVSLEKIADGQFKAVAPAGAPFDFVLPISVTNGSISGATTLTIPAGSVESEVLTVTRTSGTVWSVTVDIGTVPGLPANHSGYSLVKSDNLPLEVIEGFADGPVIWSGTITVGKWKWGILSGYGYNSDYNGRQVGSFQTQLLHIEEPGTSSIKLGIILRKKV